MNICDLVAIGSLVLMIALRRLANHYGCDCQNHQNQNCVPCQFLPRPLLPLTRVAVVDPSGDHRIDRRVDDQDDNHRCQLTRRGSKLNTHFSWPKKSEILTALVELSNDSLFGFLLGMVFGVSFIASVLLSVSK